jgi:DNA-binding NarL/FixJ family response regulator
MPSGFMNTDVKSARVLLADDHAEVLTQTGNVLAGEFEIVGSVANGVDLVKAAMQLDPDVVVIDITMPGLDGIEAARRLKRSGCRAKLVFLTVHEDPDYLRAALQSGGAAYVIKARLATDLIAAIHQALADQHFVSPTIVSNPTDQGKDRTQQ